MQAKLIFAPIAAMSVFLAVVATGCAQTTHQLQSLSNDRQLYEDGTMLWVGQVDPLPLPDPDFVPPTPPDPAGNQLLNLYGQSTTRPQTYDLVWPANPGEADICLYADDRFAAINLTIDDNTQPNHAWWLQQCALHDIKVISMATRMWIWMTSGFSRPTSGHHDSRAGREHKRGRAAVHCDSPAPV